MTWKRIDFVGYISHPKRMREEVVFNFDSESALFASSFFDTEKTEDIVSGREGVR